MTPEFLPTTRSEMDRLGWKELDVLLVTGDAYVDHPSFAAALLDHRRQCVENLRDDEWDFWVDRIKALDVIAGRKGIPMYDEPNLQREIEGLRERERARRAERVALTRESA